MFNQDIKKLRPKKISFGYFQKRLKYILKKRLTLQIYNCISKNIFGQKWLSKKVSFQIGFEVDRVEFIFLLELTNYLGKGGKEIHNVCQLKTKKFSF